MWQQILAIAWAQFRITRNHLPRTTFGAALMWFLGALWYGAFSGSALALAFTLPRVPLATLQEWLPIGLLTVFLYWQTIPLFTMSSGWGLQLNKLQIYPVRDSALFGIEALLRVTASPETVILLLGATGGLLFHPGIPRGAPLVLLLWFLPFNLFLQLAIRNFVTSAFSRSRFREFVTILLISVGVLPQFLLRTGAGRALQPYFLRVARGTATPWQLTAAAALGSFTLINLILFAAWIGLSLVWARWQFRRGLQIEDGFRASPHKTPPAIGAVPLLTALTNLFRDPMACLLQKEFQALVRMPRFRVVFGMACVFGVIVFLPMTMGHGSALFIKSNFLPVVNVYGMLLLADGLVLNVFGLDRTAAHLFFVAPVPLRTVLQAKNIVALCFIALQTLAVMLCALLCRVPLNWFSAASGLGVSAVVAVFLLAAGNLLSVFAPRGIDAASTLKKQAGAKAQLWILACSAGMLILLVFPFLARWGLQKDWAFFAVLFLEFVIGLIFYWVALDSAVERGLRSREEIVEALSRGLSPLGV